MYFSVTTYREQQTNSMEGHVHGVSASYTRAKAMFDKAKPGPNSTVTLWEVEETNGGNAYIIERKEYTIA